MGINDTMLKSFRTFRFQNHDVVNQINLDASKKDHCNIQRCKYRECNTLFDELKSNTKSQELAFITQFNSLINMSEGYNVKGYVT